MLSLLRLFQVYEKPLMFIIRDRLFEFLIISRLSLRKTLKEGGDAELSACAKDSHSW